MPVQRQENELACIRILGVLILPLSTSCVLDLGTVSTVLHFFGFHIVTVIKFVLNYYVSDPMIPLSLDNQ